MNRKKLLVRLARGAVANVAFADVLSLAEALGFEPQRISGSHHILAHPDIPEAHQPADIPDLEACSAFGVSPEAALAEVERAKEAWLTSARESGRSVPEPRYRPALYAR